MNEARKELRAVVQDKQQQPTACNHYYTDDVQRARQNASRDPIDSIVKGTADDDVYGAMHISNNGFDLKRLISALR